MQGGRILQHAVIGRAIENAKTVYLITNSRCVAAIHVYEKLGFVQDAEIMSQLGARYERCDVAMRYPLEQAL
jgi:ribosomal protein S18 acetylase RimI-like enzyme